MPASAVPVLSPPVHAPSTAARRCGSLCTEYLAATTPNPPAATPYATACSPAVGLPLLPSLALHAVACPDAHALASFGLVTGEQACGSEGTLGAAHGRIDYSCVRLGSAEDFPSSTFFSNCSAPAVKPSLATLAEPFAGQSAPPEARCPQGTALKSWELTTVGCSAAAVLRGRGRARTGTSYRFRYECVGLGSETASVRGSGAWEEVSGRQAGGAPTGNGSGGVGLHALTGRADGVTGQQPSSGAGEAQTVSTRPREYSAGSMCADVQDTLESLEGHQVACAPGSHLLGAVRVDTAGCASVGTGGVTGPERDQVRLLFQCVGSLHASGHGAIGVAMQGFEMVD